MATSDAPISVNAVTLVVNNLDRVVDFYSDVIGLTVLSKNGQSCTLGQADNALMHLREDKSAQHVPKEAGLFHTAFLLPDRASLGAWLIHSDNSKVKLEGAADHGVSEALYLSDPEGNGVEIYVDRDRSQWSIQHGLIELKTHSLNLKRLASAAESDWNGLPMGSVIGHVHLQVGNVDVADSFYRDRLGFHRSASMPQASFYGSGGYHHQIAANTWNSAGAKQKPADTTGLHVLQLKVDDPGFDCSPMVDPWGLEIEFIKNTSRLANV